MPQTMSHVFYRCRKNAALFSTISMLQKPSFMDKICKPNRSHRKHNWNRKQLWMICWWQNVGDFQLMPLKILHRGKEKAGAKLGLSCLAYNVKRAINLLGVSNIIWDDYIREDNPTRVIDAFVDMLELQLLSFKKSQAAETGRPAYDPKDLLKLYIYGYFNHIRSSRKLMIECGRNIEVMWLIGKLQPDFRTIADFRKDNHKSLKLVFREFVSLCDRLGLYGKNLVAIDGSKFRAQNSDNKCFNEAILRKKLANIDNHISEYFASTWLRHKLEEIQRWSKIMA